MTLCLAWYDRVADIWPAATQKQWQPLGSGWPPGSLLATSWKPELPAAPDGAAARPGAHKPQYLRCSSARASTGLEVPNCWCPDTYARERQVENVETSWTMCP